jgi:hypothetical protein
VRIISYVEKAQSEAKLVAGAKQLCWNVLLQYLILLTQINLVVDNKKVMRCRSSLITLLYLTDPQVVIAGVVLDSY